jgi:hypothetical protein
VGWWDALAGQSACTTFRPRKAGLQWHPSLHFPLSFFTLPSRTIRPSCRHLESAVIHLTAELPSKIAQRTQRDADTRLQLESVPLVTTPYPRGRDQSTATKQLTSSRGGSCYLSLLFDKPNRILVAAQDIQLLFVSVLKQKATPISNICSTPTDDNVVNCSTAPSSHPGRTQQQRQPYATTYPRHPTLAICAPRQ